MTLTIEQLAGNVFISNGEVSELNLSWYAYTSDDHCNAIQSSKQNIKVKITHSDGIQAETPATPTDGSLTPPDVRSLPTQYYDSFFSAKAKVTRASPIRDLWPLEHVPGMISLLAGKPNPETFPFEAFTVKSRTPSNEPLELTIDGAELSEALQYGITPGLPSLVHWVRGLQEYAHGRKANEDWGMTIGAGSQDLIYKARLFTLG
ncbi:hypothetical protein H0H81_002482 [Sphagnurus paluster]|uniref:Uncharacterized protein n=1 Tax=Sphagnurus paluster TaxID=117069 RepID=A0A9P7FVP4_9AGAR|nr:hypothetical protein H0H81_002482 [Sphagnurus paluster]